MRHLLCVTGILTSLLFFGDLASRKIWNKEALFPQHWVLCSNNSYMLAQELYKGLEQTAHVSVGVFKDADSWIITQDGSRFEIVSLSDRRCR